MQPRDLNKTRTLAAGMDSSPNGNTNSSSGHHNSGEKKKRLRDSKASPATVVMTDTYSFRAKVQKFTGMPTPPENSTCEESERVPPLLFKPRAHRAAINGQPSTLPFLSSVLTNRTNSCNLFLTDHLLNLSVIEGDHQYDAHTSNSVLQLPALGQEETSNRVSLQFKELLEELGLSENAETDVSLLEML